MLRSSLIKKSSITTQTVQKLHISLVIVDLNIIVMIVLGEMFFFYFTGKSKRRGEGKYRKEKTNALVIQLNEMKQQLVNLTTR